MTLNANEADIKNKWLKILINQRFVDIGIVIIISITEVGLLNYSKVLKYIPTNLWQLKLYQSTNI